MVLTWLRKFNCRAYDRAAIKFRGTGADLNFDISDYENDMSQVCGGLYLQVGSCKLYYHYKV